MTTLFNHGFRAFFLLAGLYAVIAMAGWMFALFTGAWPEGGMAPYLWHAHEMIFGFVGAAIAGFLLTAVPSWTGARPVSGAPLAGLAALWIGGRLALACHGYLPSGVAALIDLAFFPVLGAMLAPSLLRGKKHHLVFLLFLAILLFANAMFHVAIARSDALLAGQGLLLAVNTVLLIITIIGGRIVPAFTLGALQRFDKGATMPASGLIDRAAILGIALILLVDLFWRDSPGAGWLAAAAALIHAVRMARWKTARILQDPLVWVLHLGYSWVIIALGLKALFILAGSSAGATWLHGITTGVFATMIMAVMSRATLGHTGRPLSVPPLVTAAYGLITLAAISRIAAPVFPGHYLFSIGAAGAFWIAAFGLFLVVYAPMLVAPRIDGKPG